MRTPKITTKRVLGLVMAGALAVTGTVAIAGSSEAAVAALKLSPNTGSDAGGTIVTITGKDFQTAAGTSKVGTIFFSTSTCAIGAIGTNPVLIKSVASPTKVVITTPALALSPAGKPTAYNLCMANSALSEVIGTAKFTAYNAPLINDQSAPATKGVSVLTGASYGGGTIVITGENFTTKTTAKIGNLPIANAKVVLGSGVGQLGTVDGDDTLTGTIPAGTGVDKDVTITSEGGSVKALTAQQFDYVDALKISPAFGDGTAGNVVSVTGSGFLSRTFQSTIPTATGQSVIVLNKAATNVAVAGAYATVVGTDGVYCGSIQVESDTQLSCQVPSIAVATKSGGYTLQIVDVAAAITAVTAPSRSATYSVSAF